MLSTDFIVKTVRTVTNRHRTRDPYELCDSLGIRICSEELGRLKAYYICHNRIPTIVLNCRISEVILRILVAHELGHDRLHKDIALLKGFQEIELFGMISPTEHEANLFAAELLIEDGELLDLLNDEESSFFSMAQGLYIPADLLVYKYRIMKQKGYRIEAPYVVGGDFLKKDIDGCFGGQ